MSSERKDYTVKLYQRAGSPFWQACIYLGGEEGRQRWWSTKISVERGAGRKESRRVAQRAAEEYAASLSDQIEHTVTEDSKTTVSAVAKRMLSAKEADGRRPRAVDGLAGYLSKHVVPFFHGDRDVRTVRRADLEAFKAKLRSAGYKPTTINNALSAIRAVLKHAWRVDEVLDSVPMVANVRVDPTPKGRALTAPEVALLIKSLDPRAVEARHFLLIIANTGLRKSEAMAIRFAWIDWDARLLHLPSDVVKGGRPHPPVPLNDVALGVLKERLALHGKRTNPDDDRVFRQTKHDSARNSAAKRGGLGRVRNHDLRHTYGSLAHAAGASLIEVADLLGHSTLAMVRHYGHSYTDRLQAVSDKVQLGVPSPQKVQRVSAKGKRQKMGPKASNSVNQQKRSSRNERMNLVR